MRTEWILFLTLFSICTNTNESIRLEKATTTKKTTKKIQRMFNFSKTIESLSTSTSSFGKKLRVAWFNSLSSIFYSLVLKVFRTRHSSAS